MKNKTSNVSGPDEPYVFICYSHKDIEVVVPQIDWLREHGVSVWYDDGIEAGAVWRRQITDAIEGASILIFYVSQNSIQSVHCNHEVDYAVDKGIAVLPIYLNEAKLTPELHLVLNRVQALYPAQDPDFGPRLLEVLGAPITSTPKSSPPIRSRSDVKKKKIATWLALGTTLALFALIAVWLTGNKLENQSLIAHPPSLTIDNSIVVHPPKVTGADPALTTFADVIALDIRDALRQFQDLQLLDSQNSTSAHYTVGGSLRKGLGGIRVSVELTRSSDGAVLWSKPLEEQYDPSGALSFSKAAHVAYNVNAYVSYAKRRKELLDQGATQNQQALNAFISGLVESDAARLGDGNYRVVIDHFRRAIALDPEFTDAYARLAMTYGFRGQGQISVEEALNNVKTLLPKLHAFEPTPAVARALVFVYSRLLFDYEAALEQLTVLESTSALPPFQTQWLRCSILWFQGQLNNAVDYCAASAASSGGSLEYYTLGNLLHLTGRQSEAIEAFERSLAMTDSSQTGTKEQGVHNNAGFHLLDYLARSQYHSGNPENASTTLSSKIANQFDWYPREYAASLAMLGKTPEAIQALELMALGESMGQPFEANERFWPYFYLGDLDKTFYWMQRVIADRDVFTIGAFRGSPLLNELRKDPRFAEVMAQLSKLKSDN